MNEYGSSFVLIIRSYC